MEIGKVTGCLWATRKYHTLAGHKLLIVENLEKGQRDEVGYRVALDTVDAGIGDTVLTVRGSASKLAEGTREAATDTTIVAVVDSIENE